MANLQKMREELKRREQQLKEQETITYGWLGEYLIDNLDIDYELLGTKSEVQEVAQQIIDSLSSNPFEQSSSESELSNEATDEVSGANDREETSEQVY